MDKTRKITKNQSHQSPLCPLSYYSAAQIVGKEENNVAL